MAICALAKPNAETRDLPSWLPERVLLNLVRICPMEERVEPGRLHDVAYDAVSLSVKAVVARTRRYIREPERFASDQSLVRRLRTRRRVPADTARAALAGSKPLAERAWCRLDGGRSWLLREPRATSKPYRRRARRDATTGLRPSTWRARRASLRDVFGRQAKDVAVAAVGDAVVRRGRHDQREADVLIVWDVGDGDVAVRFPISR